MNAEDNKQVEQHMKLIAVWLLSHWMNFGRSKTIRLVELGPGRGTLMSDVLRVSLGLVLLPQRHILTLLGRKVFSQFAAARSAIRDIHLVETSSAMKDAQRETLEPFVQNMSVRLHWHDTLSELHPNENTYTMVLAHEFFDALPFHRLLVIICTTFPFLS